RKVVVGFVDGAAGEDVGAGRELGATGAPDHEELPGDLAAVHDEYRGGRPGSYRGAIVQQRREPRRDRHGAESRVAATTEADPRPSWVESSPAQLGFCPWTWAWRAGPPWSPARLAASVWRSRGPSPPKGSG